VVVADPPDITRAPGPVTEHPSGSMGFVNGVNPPFVGDFQTSVHLAADICVNSIYPGRNSSALAELAIKTSISSISRITAWRF
jgi:hypothetical protein